MTQSWLKALDAYNRLLEVNYARSHESSLMALILACVLVRISLSINESERCKQKQAHVCITCHSCPTTLGRTEIDG